MKNVNSSAKTAFSPFFYLFLHWLGLLLSPLWPWGRDLQSVMWGAEGLTLTLCHIDLHLASPFRSFLHYIQKQFQIPLVTHTLPSMFRADCIYSGVLGNPFTNNGNRCNHLTSSNNTTDAVTIHSEYCSGTSRRLVWSLCFSLSLLVNPCCSVPH